MALGVGIPVPLPTPSSFRSSGPWDLSSGREKPLSLFIYSLKKKKKWCHLPTMRSQAQLSFCYFQSCLALRSTFLAGVGEWGWGGEAWYVMSANSSGKCSNSHRGWFQVTSVIATSTENAWPLQCCVPDSSIGWSQHTPACDQPFLPQMPCPGQVASEPFPGQSGSSIILPWPACPFLCQQWWICQLPPPPPHILLLFYLSISWVSKKVTLGGLPDSLETCPLVTPLTFSLALGDATHTVVLSFIRLYVSILIVKPVSPAQPPTESSVNSGWMNDRRD